jgi:MIP family channel proteins
MNRDRAQPLVPYVAEFLGTYALVFAGPGAAAVDAASDGQVGQVGIGLSFGFAVMAMIFAFGHISGAHINPAVSLAFFVARRIPLRQLAGYVTGQLAGAALAGVTIVAIVGTAGDAGASVPSINGVGAAFLSELVLTFFLVLLVLIVATDSRAQGSLAAIAVGGYVAMAATGWGPIAGASMNPARSFGPALAANAWASHWIYWLAPGTGALLALAAYELLREPRPRADEQRNPHRDA